MCETQVIYTFIILKVNNYNYKYIYIYVINYEKY